MNPAIFGAVFLAQQSAMHRSSYSSDSPSNQSTKKKLNLNRKAMFIEVGKISMNGNVRPIVLNTSYIVEMYRTTMQPSTFNTELNRWQDSGSKIAVTDITLWDGNNFSILETPEYVMINN